MDHFSKLRQRVKTFSYEQLLTKPPFTRDDVIEHQNVMMMSFIRRLIWHTRTAVFIVLVSIMVHPILQLGTTSKMAIFAAGISYICVFITRYYPTSHRAWASMISFIRDEYRRRINFNA